MKTRELTGAALDWAVAKAEGRCVQELHKQAVVLRSEDGRGSYEYSPSVYWSQGGPIIEREGIGLRLRKGPPHDDDAEIWFANGAGWITAGPTALVAAMRCYAASKLGDEVDIPKELQ